MANRKASDGKRRDEGKESFWREAIAQQRRSGGSVLAFCESRGLNESSFYRWRKRIQLLDRQSGSTPSGGKRKAASGLAPVVVIDQTPGNGLREPGGLPESLNSRRPSAPIEIMLTDGTIVRVPSGATREHLDMVFAALESGGC